MKVTPSSIPVTGEYLKTSQERSQSDDHRNESNAPRRVQRPISASSKKEEDLDLDEIVKDFSEDPQTQAAGLHASLEGVGPGLKVVLRDESGELIRRFSGPEFAKLHDTSDGAGRGKILDKKF